MLVLGPLGIAWGVYYALTDLLWIGGVYLVVSGIVGLMLALRRLRRDHSRAAQR